MALTALPCYIQVKKSSVLPFLLFVSCTLMLAARFSYGQVTVDGNFEIEDNLEVNYRESSSRRVIAQTAGTNSTQSLLEDSQALLLVKAAITKDPYNVTRYWKRQGKRQVLNACRWLGITCTKRRVTGVNISGHALEGSISGDLGRLSHLTTLDISTNFFSGSIPMELSGATWLKSLNLGSNHLTGLIPSSLGGLKNLTYLVVANNKLDGVFPSSIVNMTSLTTLNISSNNFTGTIPSGLQNLKNLTVLDVSNNQISGGLPSTLGAWMSLVKLDSSNNPLLAGGIPTTIGDLTVLEGLWLSGCSLTGVIPQQITGCTKLKEIDLSNNHLRGSIPFQSLGNLTSLHLQNNLLEGNFVTNLGMFPNLEDIDLANNRLNGSISGQIGSLPLKYNLSLAHNNLTGSIPDGVGGLTHVQSINLSSNGFSGIIPSAIGNCTNLAELDVSSNNLTGSLPQSLDALTSLTGLNVSHNMLSGSLPTFDNLTNLRVLDASFNKFSGKVSATFVNFASLLFLNVSYNGLSGELPVFTAHDNVTADSFRNNSLCGSILNIVCGGGSSDKLSTKTIIYIVIGSVAGFIVAVGILYFCVACWKARKSKGSKHSSQVSAELQLQLSSEEILTATKGFDDENRIGIGKLSTVHRGVLPDETVVAVKRLAITKSAPGKELENAPSLDEELETLGHIRHRSLVKVLGYCSTEQIKALVLEYMPNGTLDGLLYPPREAEVVKVVDWNLRFNSAIAIAEGLKFLHHDCRRPTVHGDIKPSNVLFDAKMEAKVADCGVARILADQGFGPSASPSSSPSGSAYGYTSPEVAASGIPTLKGDIYSYGIVVLEMITGRHPYTLELGQTLPQWVRSTISNSKTLQNVLDPILMNDVQAHQQKMAMVLGVALLCTRENPQERPQMDDVLKMLIHIKTRPANNSRRRFSISSRQNSSTLRRTTSEIQRPTQPPMVQPLPHNPSLSDWTPTPDEIV